MAITMGGLHHQQLMSISIGIGIGGSSSPLRRPLAASAPPQRPRPVAVVRSSSSLSSTQVKQLKLTYLEINSWLWEVGGSRILVDPILAGNLDFGAPWLFDAAKKRLKNLGVDDLVRPQGLDLLLITQSLDDHCHARTLAQLAAAAPDLAVVTTPNARPVLAALPTPFRDVTYLEPGQSTTTPCNGVRILATPGPVLGPPWQRPENGYIIMDQDQRRRRGLVYYEPHCVYDRSFLEKKGLHADVVITPVVKQLLPANFTLVAGQEDAVQLATLLRPRYVVPMSNGDVDAKGLLTAVLATQGTVDAFKAMLAEALPEAQLLDPTPGVPLHLDLDLDLT
ncbi:hypothetical protein E2562_028943 [Oryza meyeriana var. granulata]|uniref:Metallo-beta-lactamase domain-containing protein n=1 Tax=Oryza meyeriana var. granulata TaxID=110450 RepID=A0A6G1DPM6_9ORYZ|nr:hypothetical protein E2562_028943 [Oryza meyeriana var. granulata]